MYSLEPLSYELIEQLLFSPSRKPKKPPGVPPGPPPELSDDENEGLSNILSF